jgi:hypothetical protein
MNYDIFENDQEKAEAKQRLPELEKHPGWKFILRVIDKNVEYLTRQLRTRKDKSLEDMHALQDRIDDIEQFKDLPQSILQEIDTIPEEEPADIYE